MGLEDQIDFESFYMGQSAGRADREEAQRNRDRLRPNSLLHDIFNRSFDESTFKASVKRRMDEHETRLIRQDPALAGAARALGHWMATVDAKLAWLEAYYPEPDVFRAHGGTQKVVTPEEVAEIKSALKSLADIMTQHLKEEAKRLALAPVPEIAPLAKLATKFETKYDAMFAAVDAQFKESAARLQRLDDAILTISRKQAMSAGTAPAPAASRLLRLYAMFLTNFLIVAGLAGVLVWALRRWGQ